jgi:nicotinamide phosphoribosyltransferase
MKASSAKINGEWFDVVKDPITDPGKKSKAGRVTLWRSGGEFVSAVEQPKGWYDKGIGDFVDVLETVYLDGKLIKDITFDEVRANAMK